MGIRHLVGYLSRAVVFLTLFCLTMVFIFIVGGRQHFQDTSLSYVLFAETTASGVNIVLCALLFAISVISAVRDTKRVRYIKNVLLSIASGALSFALLFVSLSVRLLSAGL